MLFLLSGAMCAAVASDDSVVELPDTVATVRDSLTISANDCDTLSATDADSCDKRPSFLRRLGKGIIRTADAVTDFFSGCDTNYVTPQLYEFTAQAELSYWHDYYRMSSSETGTTNHMTLQSGNPLILGGYVYWSILGYGYSSSIDGLGTSRGARATNVRNSFVLNTASIIAEIYTFKSGQSAEITSISGISDREIEQKGSTFTGLSSRCFGINAEYIFNHRRYSWPAAFGENAVQRRSQGSWKLGFSYNQVNVDFDRATLSPYILERIDTTLLFSHVAYRDYAVSFGYGYNWAFRRNCLFAFSVLPSLGYRKTDITETDLGHDILRNVSTDLFFRMSLFWNNTRFFSGIVLDIHTYSYRQRKFGLTNTYGSIKYIAGFNFMKKRQYKKSKR